VITILDGGMGQELIARSGGKATPMWSLQALLDAPELIRQVHDDYFSSGAMVATTDSYVILPDRLKHYGFPDRQAELMEKACRLAMEARDAHGTGQVAGSWARWDFLISLINALKLTLLLRFMKLLLSNSLILLIFTYWKPCLQ